MSHSRSKHQFLSADELNIQGKEAEMLTLFGSIAVAIMFLSYWLEPRSKWFVLVFSGACAATSAYSALAGVYPITVIEALWSVVAFQRFSQRSRQEASGS